MPAVAQCPRIDCHRAAIRAAALFDRDTRVAVVKIGVERHIVPGDRNAIPFIKLDTRLPDPRYRSKWWVQQGRVGVVGAGIPAASHDVVIVWELRLDWVSILEVGVQTIAHHHLLAISL